MNYTDTYGNMNDLRSLPRSPRTYFDALCHEFGDYPVEQKLLDIGYLTTMGYDIRKDIYHSFQNYDHVTEDNVHAVYRLSKPPLVAWTISAVVSTCATTNST